METERQRCDSKEEGLPESRFLLECLAVLPS